LKVILVDFEITVKLSNVIYWYKCHTNQQYI